MDELAKELESMGYTVDLCSRGIGILIIRNYTIMLGRDAGKIVDIGFPANGYPDNPPAAVHIKPILSPPARGSVQPQCPLGPDWIYWSRTISDWPKDRSTKRIMNWLNSVFYYE